MEFCLSNASKTLCRGCKIHVLNENLVGIPQKLVILPINRELSGIRI